MRIAIVNDMALAVEAIRRIIAAAPGHQLAWIARDGAEAVARCAQDTPDLVLMDLRMPKLDGVEATRRIMQRSPCAIVVVTASVEDNASKVFEAMGAGALDAVNTPVLPGSNQPDGGKTLLRKIETIERLVGVHSRRRQTATARGDGATARRVGFDFKDARLDREQLVAIGASAGGPAALVRILSRLPDNFPASIVVVQHVDAQFAPGLASWLDLHSELPVRLAQEGDRPQPGVVLLAGAARHLVFTAGGRLGYSPQPAACAYLPSVDVFFRSAIAQGDRGWPGDVIGVLLTGMGRDGAAGLQALRQAGHATLVQDRTSSAVYGMPKAAVELLAATEVLPLENIGPRLTEILISRAGGTIRRSGRSSQSGRP